MAVTTEVTLQVCSKELQAKHPELYHYTSKRGLEGIMSTNTIWAMHYRNLNDLSEITHIKDQLVKAMTRKFSSLIFKRGIDSREAQLLGSTGGSRKIASDFVDALFQSTFDGEQTTTRVEAFVSCFCTHTDDTPYVRANGLLSQWRGYSGGDGFCIVFDTRSLCDLIGMEFDSRYWVHLQMRPVSYAFDDTLLEDLFPELVDAGEKSLRDFLSGISVPEMGVKEFLEGATLFKHQGFQEEREVRIVAIPGTEALRIEGMKQHLNFPANPVPNIIPSDDGRRRVILFDGLGIQLPISRLIVGPSRNQAENVKFARSILRDGIRIDCSATPWLPPKLPS